MCLGGVLKEVKAEPTIDVPDILPVEDGSHNVDQKQFCHSSNHDKMECESQLKAYERNDTGVKPFAVAKHRHNECVITVYVFTQYV